MSDIFNKIDKILNLSNYPEEELKEMIFSNDFKNKPFDLIYNLQFVEQNKIHHKEGNVFNHTLLTIKEANKVKDNSKNPSAFMWGAFLHDIGKLTTTKIKKGKVTSYNHDIEGFKISKEFLGYSNFSKEFIEEVSLLVRWHMQPLFIVKGLPFADLTNMVLEVDTDEIALLSRCDRLGRVGVDIEGELKQNELFKRKVKEFKRQKNSKAKLLY